MTDNAWNDEVVVSYLYISSIQSVDQDSSHSSKTEGSHGSELGTFNWWSDPYELYHRMIDTLPKTKWRESQGTSWRRSRGVCIEVDLCTNQWMPSCRRIGRIRT
jgi:hypothetical protein